MSGAVAARRLNGAELREHLDALAEVLFDCVAGGASVSYMWPFSREQAREAFAWFALEAEAGRRMILAAFADRRVVGTVQVVDAVPPNQPHRGEIVKLLVHRSARAERKSLLVLDTVTGSTAERLYERLAWNRLGVVPEYALYPDGSPCDATFFWKAL